MRTFFKSQRGTAVTAVLFAGMIMVFIILPLFSVVIERYIIQNKAQKIKDAIDMANIAVYSALDTSQASCTVINLDDGKAMQTYCEILAKNLSLNPDLTPKSNSIASDKVKVNTIALYSSGFPVICPNGAAFSRPAVHTVVIVPVKPLLYRAMVLNAIGSGNVNLVVHEDTEFPVNNQGVTSF